MIPLKVRSMVGLIPLFAVETLEPELLDEAAGLRRAAGVVPQLPARPGAAGVALARAGQRRAPAAVAAARPSHEDAAAAHARRDRVPVATTACARCRRYHARASVRRSTCNGHDAVGRLSAGRIGLRPVRRQLELARADLVPGQLPAHRVAAEVPPLLRRRLQGRVPDRLRAAS